VKPNSSALLVAIVLSISGVVLSYIVRNMLFPGMLLPVQEAITEFVCSTANDPWGNDSLRCRFLIVDVDYESGRGRRRLPDNYEIARAARLADSNGALLTILDFSLEYRQDALRDSLAAIELGQARNLCLVGALQNGRTDGDLLNIDLAPVSRFALPTAFPSEVTFGGKTYASLPLESYLRSAHRFGFVSYRIDRNLRFCTVPLLYEHGGRIYPSCALSCYAYLEGIDMNAMAISGGALLIGGREIPTESGELRVPTWPKGIPFETIPFAALTTTDPSVFRDRIVLFGSTLNGLDFHALKSKEPVFGTRLIAQQIWALMGKHFLVEAKWTTVLLLSVVSGLLVAFLSMSRWYPLGLVCTILVSYILPLVSMLIYNRGFLLNPMMPIMSACFTMLLSFGVRIWLLNRRIRKSNSVPT